MRVLATADLHGDHEVYRWLVRVSEDMKPDAVILAGDLLGCPDGYRSVEEAQRADASEILSILTNIQAPILFVMGNDDLVELESSSSQFQALHGLRFEMQGFNFVGYQYSLPFMGGLFEKPEVEIEEDLAALASQIDERTVLVSHSPVYGILDIVAMGGHAGSKSLKKVVELKNPLAHVHGHIHSCFGVSGRHFNVAAAWKRRAMVLDLESQRHEVVTEAVV